MVELALLFPVLLILLSGLIEFSFILTQYLSLMDAARNAARFASDGLYYEQDNIRASIDDMSEYDIVCVGDPNDSSIRPTQHFFRQTACLVNQELLQEVPSISLNDNGTEVISDDYLDPMNGNDIIISAFSFTEGVGITNRHPDSNGWSYAEDLNYTSEKESRFTSDNVTDRLFSLNSPNTGYVLVEIFYYYDQLLKLPWITAIIDDPLLMHVYAFMPLTSAEPTPTPSP
jgi:hypothetical protein